MTSGKGPGVRRGGAFLGVAGLLEYTLQFLLPVILVRTLTPEAFGDYRLVWLLATSALAIFPLAIPLSLFHFLPKAAAPERPVLVGNALLFVALSGLAATALLLLTWRWMPESIAGLQEYSLLVPVFLGLWVAGSLLDVLPTADGNPHWQAGAIVGLGILRTAALGLAAILSQDVSVVLMALCLFALTKTLLALLYARISASTPGLALQGSLLLSQISYALPFAIGNALFLLRVQADQWIVAAFFPPDVFALISIATVSMAVSSLIRQPLNNATLPRLSRIIGEGDLRSAAELLRKTYTALSAVLLPVLGILFVLADELVEIVYTPAYLGAAPLMQLYLLGQMTGVFAAGHLLVILNAGRLATMISAVCLALSITLSLLGVHWFGLSGAVTGSVASLVIGEIWALVAATGRLRTSIAAVLNVQIIAKVLCAISLAIVGALAAKALVLQDLPPWLRIAGAGTTYLAIGATIGMLLRLHRTDFGLGLATVLRRRT